jgi:nitrile hydratase
MPYVSHADIGGCSDFGPVVPEPEGTVFHAAWEPRVHAVTLALGATGSWNLDMARSARETLPDYLNLTYYEIWLSGLEKLLIGKRLVTPDELTAGCNTRPPRSPRSLRPIRLRPSWQKGHRPSARRRVRPASNRANEYGRARRRPSTTRDCPAMLAARPVS